MLWLHILLVFNLNSLIKKDSAQRQSEVAEHLTEENVRLQTTIEENMKDKQVEFWKDVIEPDYVTTTEAMKKFSLSTKIKCDMDFQNFPFDEHICYLEVS